MIPKIVIDTNIYISAIFWGGKPRSVVDLGRNGQISIFTSSTLPIKASRKITVIDDDPDDDKFIECAVASRAGFIVSGDKHLLNLKEYKGIKNHESRRLPVPLFEKIVSSPIAIFNANGKQPEQIVCPKACCFY